MSDRTDAVSALHTAREGISELFAGERIAAGIVHDMVARLDPDLIGADRVVGRGWRSALQVDSLQQHKDDAAFWRKMYGYYRDVCMNTQSLAGDVASFEVLFQADEYTSNWSPDNVAQIMHFCREVQAQAQVQAPELQTQAHTAEPKPETEPEAEPQVQPEVAFKDAEADDTDAGDEQYENAAQLSEPTLEAETAEEPAEDEGLEEQPAQDAEEEPVASEQEETEKPKRRRRRRSKAGKPKQKATQPRKMREAPEREMSVKTAADGVIQPVDLDFRVANAEHNAEIMPYVRSEVHADAAHIKGAVSGVHLYLAHTAFDLLDEGLRARGVAHNLGLGSALSALLLAVLPISKTQYLKLSPMMEEAVEVMREKLSWSASEYLIDMGESVDKAVGVMRDMFELSSLAYQEALVNSYVSSLNLAERVGATNLPIGIQPEHIEVDNAAAQEIARKVRAQIAEDIVYAEERKHRSVNFFKNKDD